MSDKALTWVDMVPRCIDKTQRMMYSFFVEACVAIRIVNCKEDKLQGSMNCV